MSRASDIALRRNGRQQACEPCRRLKLRCDHGAPWCGRCTRRDMTDKCIYHPAPMTRPRSSIATRTPDKTPSIKTPASATLAATETPAPTSSWDPEPEMLDVDLPETADQGTLFKRAHTDYYGTSFSAPFSENRATIGAELLEMTAEDEQALNVNIAQLKSASKEENRTKMRQGINTLRVFPTAETCDRLVETLISTHEFVLSPSVVKRALERFWFLYKADFDAPRSCAKMSRVVLDICKNGKTPMSTMPEENQTLLDWFIGPRMRWELLGILYSFFGMAFISLQEWDPIFQLPELHGLNRKTAAWKMKLAADGCLDFVHDTDTLNDVVVLLQMNVATLHSVCSGDESYQVSRRFSQVVDAVITRGLHRLPAEDDTPLQQWRRALFASADFLDKGHSSFNSRPPLMTSQWCRKRPFYDLSSEDLFSTPAQLRVAISKLDANGWNKEGKVHDLTWARSLYAFTPIREEILTMSLGIDLPPPPAGRIDELCDRLDAIVAASPAQLQYSEAAIQAATGQTLFRLLRNRSEFLENKFLLERLRVARCQGNGQGLLNVAQASMRNVLVYWLRRDELSVFNAYFDWMVVCYGIPAAGVLAVELLKTTRSAVNTPSVATSTATSPFIPNTQPLSCSQQYQATQPSLQFSRSQVVQDLTMFLGFLDWIRPTDGNYLLCSKLRKVIRRIIDNVLDPPKYPSTTTQLGTPQPPTANQRTAASPATTNYHPTNANGVTFGGGLGGVGGGIMFDPGLASGISAMDGRVDGMNAMALEQFWMPPVEEGECLDWLGSVDWTTQGNWTGLDTLQ